VSQDELDKKALDELWEEIDTGDRLLKLMNQLDVCMSFLATIGGDEIKKIDGQTLLQVGQTVRGRQVLADVF
jgi:hypothetical protein